MRNEVFHRPSDLITWFKTTTEAAAAAAAAASRARQQQLPGPSDGTRRVSRFNPIDRNTVVTNNSYGSGGMDPYGRNQQPFQSVGHDQYRGGY